jgi:hypothetical protein
VQKLFLQKQKRRGNVFVGIYKYYTGCPTCQQKIAKTFGCQNNLPEYSVCAKTFLGGNQGNLIAA